MFRIFACTQGVPYIVDIMEEENGKRNESRQKTKRRRSKRHAETADGADPGHAADDGKDTG